MPRPKPSDAASARSERARQRPGPADLAADRREIQQHSRRDVKPILEELRAMIRRSELSQRQVEEAAGFSRGYLSQLLAQNLDLKVWHLLAILELFEEHPGDFFHRLLPGAARPEPLANFAARSAPPGDELLTSIDRLYRVGVESLADLRRRLERLDGVVDQLEASGVVEPPPEDE